MTHEWVDWAAAMRLLKKAGVPSPWYALGNWAEHGNVETMAGSVVGVDGGHIVDEVLPTIFWRARPSPLTGSLKLLYRDEDEGDGPANVVHILAPVFRKDQLVAMVPHLTAEQVTDALLPEVNEADEPPAQVPKARRLQDGGRPISDRWPDFLAELMLWFEEANEDTAGLTSGKLIAKINDRLAFKGLEPLPRSTGEAAVKRMLEVLNGPSRA